VVDVSDSADLRPPEGLLCLLEAVELAFYFAQS